MYCNPHICFTKRSDSLLKKLVKEKKLQEKALMNAKDLKKIQH